MEIIINEHPKNHIINVGNNEIINVERFVELCYQVAGQQLKKIYVTNLKTNVIIFVFISMSIFLMFLSKMSYYQNKKICFLGCRDHLFGI